MATRPTTIKGAVEYVDFQLDNIKGYVSINDNESALIKCKYLKDAVTELEKQLKQ
jgi:hypothetical protein